MHTHTQNCPTCWDDDQEGFSLPKCKHFQCSLCWGEYLENKIQTGKVRVRKREKERERERERECGLDFRKNIWEKINGKSK